jgi:hypothetical protein
LLISHSFSLQIFSWVSFDCFAYFPFVFAFRFLLFRFDAKQAKSSLFWLPSETKFLLQFQFSLPKRKLGRTLLQ